jgi:DNA-binding CsgD family transcriptional regulator
MSDLIEADSLVTRGHHGLSLRELDVLRLAKHGVTDKEIADDLGLSVATLRTYWNRIREKLGAINRTHAIVLASAGAEPTEAAPRDERARTVESMLHNQVAMWVWNGRCREALMDEFGRGLFAFSNGDAPIVCDTLLANVWRPDRLRFERYLSQAAELRLMTPIELRVGAPGDYRHLVRTVNLAAQGSGNATLLLATTVMHVFAPGDFS